MRLYVVHGSHPCAAVEKAMSIKGPSYDVTEWPPTLHAPMQLALFGARTVPALKLDGEKISDRGRSCAGSTGSGPIRRCIRPTRPRGPGRGGRRWATMADARPLFAGRPCAEVATALFPDTDGEMPAGSLPTV